MIINHIYILDDEQEQINLLSRIIGQCGIPSTSFCRAKQFFQLTEHYEKNSILLLDLNMPDIDGIEVMRMLAEHDSPPRLILMTGHDSSVLHSAEKLGKAHQLDIITSFNKPIDIDRLEALLRDNIPSNQSQHYSVGAKQPAPISPESLLEAIAVSYTHLTLPTKA